MRRIERKLLPLAMAIACLLAVGCKKSQAELEAEESRKVIESKAALRERLHKAKIARHERQEWLKAHPEVLDTAEPDETHRPTEAAPSELPPALLGAPTPPDPAVIASAYGEFLKTAPSADPSASPPPNRPKNPHVNR